MSCLGLFGNAFDSPDGSDVDEGARREEDELFERMARAVVSRGLTSPALLFLELHRPLGFIAGQALHGFAPLAALALSRADVDRLARSLCRRDGAERLIACIERTERLSHAPAGPKAAEAREGAEGKD